MHNELCNSNEFRRCLGNMGKTTFWRHRQRGLISEPDAYMGDAPNSPALWLRSTINATVQRFVERAKPEQAQAAAEVTGKATAARQRQRNAV